MKARVNSASKLRPLCFALFMFLSAWSTPTASIVAQPETISHRKLELPEGGTSDVQRQLLMLQHLQSLVAQQNQAADSQPRSRNDRTNVDEKPPIDVTPEQLQMFQQLLQRFGGNIPPDSIPDVNELAPDLVNSVMSDPDKQKQVMEMLKDFAQNRRMPQPSGSGGPSIPRQQTLPNEFPNNFQNSADQNSGTQRPNKPIESSNAPPTDDAPQKVESMEDIMRLAKEFQQKFMDRQRNSDPSQQPSDENRNNAAPQNQNGSQNVTQPQSGTPPTETLPKTASEWNDLLKSIAGNDVPPGTQRNQGRQRNGNGNPSVPDNQPQRSRNAASDGQPPSTVTEFLKKLGTVPLEELRPDQFADGRLPPDLRNGTGKNTSDNTAQQAPPSLESRNNVSAEVQEMRDEVKSDLQRKGFQRTIRDLVRSAQKEAKEAGPSSPAVAPGTTPPNAEAPVVEGALLRAFDGIRKDLVEIVKDGKFKAPKNTSSKPKSGQSIASNQTPSGTGGGFRESATEFFTDLASGPESLPTPSPSAASPDAMPDLPSLTEGSGGGTFAILVAAVLCIAAFLLARRFGIVGPQSDLTGARRFMTSSQIRTKADVIDAFHAMALKPHLATEDWWTHHKVASDIAEQSPEQTYQIRVLSELYEQARYLPDDTEFTDAQIQEARRAIQQCER